MTEKTEDTGAKTGEDKSKSWVEEIEVAGEKLVEEVKRLAAEGQARRLRVIEPDGDIAVDIPLTVGAVAGGVVVLAAPVLAIIGAIAAFAAKVKIEVVRDAGDDKAEES